VRWCEHRLPIFQSCACLKIGLFGKNKSNNNNMYLRPGAAAAAAATILKKLGK
tara:strand:- start:7238 stop:7396 length:159 start_codon:yes stop_codon:yes gene_type:complete